MLGRGWGKGRGKWVWSDERKIDKVYEVFAQLVSESQCEVVRLICCDLLS